MSWKRLPPYKGAVAVVVTAVGADGIKIFRETVDQQASFARFSDVYSELVCTDEEAILKQGLRLQRSAEDGRVVLVEE